MCSWSLIVLWWHERRSGADIGRWNRDLRNSDCSLVGLPQGHFATWIDGKTTVDYVMLDEDLLPSVVSCGYMPFMEHVQGNHRAMYVDFDNSMLFGAKNSQLAPHARQPARVSHKTAPCL